MRCTRTSWLDVVTWTALLVEAVIGEFTGEGRYDVRNSRIAAARL